MNFNEKLQSAILKNDVDQAKYILKEIKKESFIQISLHTILNMATLHSTPQMIELIMDELSKDLSSHILMGAFDNINTGTERYFENYKKFIQKALPEMSFYLIEQITEEFLKKNNKSKYEVLYQEEFLKILKTPCFNDIKPEFIQAFEYDIQKEKLKLNLENF